MVKIGFVTAEIFLIWTNGARTNVAWTNVTCQLESVKDGLRNLPLKFGQNGVNNSWDIVGIEFAVLAGSASASHFWQNHHVVIFVSWWQVDRWTGDQSTGNLILTYLAFWRSKIGATVQKLRALFYRKYFRLKKQKF